jgi:hypothetical protein
MPIILYTLINIGEAFNQLSTHTLAQFPEHISEHLIQVRNLLCHSERNYNRLVIHVLLNEHAENPVIHVNNLCYSLPIITKCALDLLKKYKVDGSNIKSIEDTKVKGIWTRIISEIPKTTDEHESRNVLYTSMF